MTLDEQIKSASESVIRLAAQLDQVIPYVDQHGDWHVPIDDLNLGDYDLDSAFFEIKNPTAADRTLYTFFKAIPEWLRYAVLDCYEGGYWK